MENSKSKETMKILNFSEMISEKLENENPDKPKEVNPDKGSELVNYTTTSLPVVGKIKNISTFIEDIDTKTTNMGKKDLENVGSVVPQSVNTSKGDSVVNYDTTSLPVAGKIKNISTFIEDIDTKAIAVLKDKGVTMSTYDIAGCCGVCVDELHNVLSKLADGGKIIKRTWGKDNFWFIQKVD